MFVNIQRMQVASLKIPLRELERCLLISHSTGLGIMMSLRISLILLRMGSIGFLTDLMDFLKDLMISLTDLMDFLKA